nr:MAG TPA: RNA polymerase inhibitor [Caudoviricetes sp.]
MKKYLVTVEVDGIITNRLVKAETAEEAERKAKEEEE